MSRKASLTKKIAHTLMAMSIVYSSGINIVVNEVYAAEKTENITSSGGSFTETGADGTDSSSSSPGPVTDGENAVITGKITEAKITNGIFVAAIGGDGGDDRDGTLTVGAKGGDAAAMLTVDKSLSSVETGNITVTAEGGINGTVYHGANKVAGAAAAYGLAVKHDLTIKAADIYVSAKSKYLVSYNPNVDIDAAKQNDTIAAGLQVDEGKVIFSGVKITAEAKTSSYLSAIGKVAEGATKFSDGGNAEVYGIRVNGGDVTAKLTGTLKIAASQASKGSGSRNYQLISSLTRAVDGGDGGNAVAYGVEVNGGLAHLDLQDIEAKVADEYTLISGGAGGSAANTGVVGVAAGHGGDGGNAKIAGVHVAGGKADGTINNIAIDVTLHNNSAMGGDGGVTTNTISGSGGAGGGFYAAGISNTGCEAELTVAGMDIKAAGCRGGDLGELTVTDASKITAAGAVQASAGKGGEALVVGVDNRGGSSKVTVTGDIKLAATGGAGGGGTFRYQSASAMTEEAAKVLAAERVSGAGGEAIAIGLQNTDGSLTADVKKLEITAIGGVGGFGMSNYSTVNGASAVGGAAAAYGINVLGGSAESLTVAEITVEATGGSSSTADVANMLNAVNSDGAGIVGG